MVLWLHSSNLSWFCRASTFLYLAIAWTLSPGEHRAQRSKRLSGSLQAISAIMPLVTHDMRGESGTCIRSCSGRGRRCDISNGRCWRARSGLVVTLPLHEEKGERSSVSLRYTMLIHGEESTDAGLFGLFSLAYWYMIRTRLCVSGYS